MIAHEMTVLNDIRTEMLSYRKKTNPERLKDFLDKSEMNISKIKPNAVIEILENKEKQIQNVIDYLQKSKSGVLDLHRRYCGQSVKELMDLHIEKVFCKSPEEIRKELNKN